MTLEEDTEQDLAFIKIRDERDRAWAALYQIKKAMPRLRELLPYAKGLPKAIQLGALVSAVLDVIASGLPEEYTDEEGPDDSGTLPDPGSVGGTS